MNTSGFVRIEALSKDNFDTWKIQMEAMLVKNDAWKYVSGESVKPELIEGNAQSVAAVEAWNDKDSKAKSDLILAINPSELKQIKGCITSREVWVKLEGIYQSKGPARKATLLKQLTLQKMREDDDIREHMRKFFDAVDKLSEMEVHINPDLLAIMLLYSLPPGFENFRCAIEARDDLPPPDTLRVKIIEESDARNSTQTSEVRQNVLLAEKKGQSMRVKFVKNQKPKFKCYRCGKPGHKASECKTEKDRQGAGNAGRVSLYAEFANNQPAGLRCDHNESVKKWCLDSGCTAHLSKDASDFTNLDTDNLGTLNLANKSSVEIKGKGSVSLIVNAKRKVNHIELNNALYVPELRTNLMSVAKITDRGFKVVFDKNNAKVIDANNQVKVMAYRENDLYFVRENRNVKSRETETSNRATVESPLKIWHQRLGHLNIRDLRDAIENDTIRGIKSIGTSVDFDCEICAKGKMARPAFPKESERKTKLLDIIHTDVCGPMRVKSNGGSKYFVTFIDDASRWCTVKFIKSKDEVLKEFKAFKAHIENRHGRRIKCIQSDNGREYINKEFERFLAENGIEHRTSAPYTPQQNGLAERFNRTLVEAARCSLIQSELPPAFWAEAVSTACFVRNRCPSKGLQGKTPYEICYGRPPNVSFLKSFGCTAYCWNRLPTKGKFDARAKEGIFLGYCDSSKAYRIWLPVESRVEITRDVKFTERVMSRIEATTNKPISENHPNVLPEDHPENGEVDIELSRNDEARQHVEADEPDAAEDDVEDHVPNPPAIRRVPENARRGRGRPRLLRTGLRGKPRKIYQAANFTEEEVEEVNTAEVVIQTALSSPDASEWMEAMGSEVKSILKMNTWEIIDRPERCKVIGSRIVLRNKYDSQGQIERRKARIVAQGCAQFPGIDFTESYAPVSRLSSIRLATALAARYGMKIHQIDIATAYLNGTIDEKVYMKVPKHFTEVLEFVIRNERENNDIRAKATAMLNQLKSGDKVCLVKKALYGLRQAGRSWYTKINKVLLNFGAKTSKSDPCVYYTGSGEDLTLIIIYVDDVLVMSRHERKINEVKTYLSEQFDIRDMGLAKYCLGLEFEQRKNSITMTQKGYIRDILDRFGMTNCNPVSTPIEMGSSLKKCESGTNEEDARSPYRELVGSLMYLAVGTRPDIAYSVSHLSQFNSCHDKSHWTAAKRVLRYLKGTMDTGLKYEVGKTSLIGYADADWASCTVDRRSYTGYVFILNGAAISWESRKQRTVALSSTEAEYMALSEASKESIYLRKFLEELGTDLTKNIVVKCDNIGAQSLGKNPIHHSRTKHIDVRHHFIRDVLSDGLMKVEYVPTTEMVADILTKGLPRPKQIWCTGGLGLRDTSPTSVSRGSVRK